MERQTATKVQKSPARVNHGSTQHATSSVTAHRLLDLQRFVGSQAVQRLILSPYIQTKLSVSIPGDPFEQEADRVADKVMRMPESMIVRRVPLAVREDDDEKKEVMQRACADCEHEKDKEETISRLPEAGLNAEPADAGAATAGNIHAMHGGGMPLPDSTRAFFEPRFGADFSHVRVHTDARAAGTANAINAKAFTVGNNIAFGENQYSPHSLEGRQLLAHELTHVVQQDTVSPQRIYRDDGGMTSAQAPASTSGDRGPSASVPTAADIEQRDLVKAALESGDPADVKKIKNFSIVSEPDKFKLIRILLDQTWVGPFDEYALEDIWRSFGARLITVASTEDGFKLWQQSIDAGAELDDFPAVKQLQKQFVDDIKAVVTSYLKQNLELVANEMQRLGIPIEETAQLPAATPQQEDEIKKMQAAAVEVAKLQKAQEEARELDVGYEVTTIGSVTGGETSTCSLVKFNPYVEPPMRSSPANPFLYCPSGKITPYEEVKAKYDPASKKIEEYVDRYPSLYSISREGKSATTADFAKTVSPAKAREQLGTALRALRKDIEGTQTKLDTGDLNPLDLLPIHEQLTEGGVKAQSGVDWKVRLPKSIAAEMVKDHQFTEALKALGLQTAAAAMFMLAPFTGGASIYVMLGALAVTGAKLYLSTQQYETLAQAAVSSPKTGTALVTKPQVDEAKMAMEADQIAFALAALAVGLAAAAKVVGAIRGAGAPAPGRASVDVRKFSEYIFKEGDPSGKAHVFKSLGYGPEHAEQLAGMYQEQGAAKFANNEYTLGKLDQHGQRIDIEIKLKGIGDNAGKVSNLKSGWMIKPDGSISLNTPFSGFTQ